MFRFIFESAGVDIQKVDFETSGGFNIKSFIEMHNF